MSHTIATREKGNYRVMKFPRTFPFTEDFPQYGLKRSRWPNLSHRQSKVIHEAGPPPRSFVGETARPQGQDSRLENWIHFLLAFFRALMIRLGKATPYFDHRYVNNEYAILPDAQAASILGLEARGFEPQQHH